MSVRVRTLEQDPALRARVVSRTRLVYPEGAREHEDRPAFVRAASGLASMAGELAVVQDDASFLAVVALDGALRSIPLPRSGGRRRFETRLGNRLDKPDLEALVCVGLTQGERLLALGSGSLPVREVAVVVDPKTGSSEMIGTMALHQALRDALELGPGELNVEGALCAGGVLRFLHRGASGRPSGSAEIELAAFLDWLLDSRDAACPELTNPCHYHLGATGGAAFGLTDGSALDAQAWLFSAAAEQTDDPVLDGAVFGSLIGVVDRERVRAAALTDERGLPLAVKAEGIARTSGPEPRLFVVLDGDDPDSPAELCEVELEGV